MCALTHKGKYKSHKQSVLSENGFVYEVWLFERRYMPDVKQMIDTFGTHKWEE